MSQSGTLRSTGAIDLTDLSIGGPSSAGLKDEQGDGQLLARRGEDAGGAHRHPFQIWVLPQEAPEPRTFQVSFRSSFNSHMSTDARVPGVSDESSALNTWPPASMSSALSNC